MSDPTTPREIIASLRQQITAMKKEWEEERREIAELRAHAERVGEANDRLVVENAELRKDEERLDYIFWPSCSRKARARMLKLIGTPGYRDDQGGMLAWRVAIDDARKEAQP